MVLVLLEERGAVTMWWSKLGLILSELRRQRCLRCLIEKRGTYLKLFILNYGRSSCFASGVQANT